MFIDLRAIIKLYAHALPYFLGNTSVLYIQQQGPLDHGPISLIEITESRIVFCVIICNHLVNFFALFCVVSSMPRLFLKQSTSSQCSANSCSRVSFARASSMTLCQLASSPTSPQPTQSGATMVPIASFSFCAAIFSRSDKGRNGQEILPPPSHTRQVVG